MPVCVGEPLALSRVPRAQEGTRRLPYGGLLIFTFYRHSKISNLISVGKVECA